MIDFTGLLQKEDAPDASDILSFFETLDRKTSHIELRPSQLSAIQQLTDLRSQQDSILKLSTGAGKTTVGLLYLASHMHEKQEPVVFFCPTKQLCTQVHTEASKLGIPAHIYRGGERHPHHECLSADAICICTYDKLFNAKTTFDRQDVMLRPCAIVLDDAHAGLEKIREAFTLRITMSEFLNELLAKLTPICEEYKPAVWVQIWEGNPHQSIEIPFWSWKSLSAELLPIIAKHAKDSEHQFVIPLLLETLKWCRCVISIQGIEIIPQILPIEQFSAYTSAKHRLFMSATLADDSVLVRDLGCTPEGAKKAIVPETDRGMGERMVVAPSLINPDYYKREWVMQLCANLRKSNNVVVLSPSERMAREWEEYGATVHLSNEIHEAVENLRNTNSGNNFVVLTQRYDGVDLPDDACRILVIDGLPIGEGIIDSHDTSLNTHSSGVCHRLVYRIEQGMGRAVRSHADYAVVLLAGGEIASFVAKVNVQKSMNPETRAQLALAIELAKLAAKEDNSENALIGLIDQCLQRNDGWKQYYNQRVRESGTATISESIDENLILASAERNAFLAAIGNNPVLATKILSTEMNKCDLDDRTYGAYLQLMASYTFETSQSESFKIQTTAFAKNRDAFCPPIIPPQPIDDFSVKSLDKMLAWLSEFVDQTGALAFLSEQNRQLDFRQTVKQFEESLKELATPLGATGSRPEKEYGNGPDCLWLWGRYAFVIEAKTQNENTLHKKDSGQLANSIEWFKKTYPDIYTIIPLTVSKMNITDADAHYNSETKVLMPSGIEMLLSNLNTFYKALVELPLLASDKNTLAKEISRLGLTSESFISTYCVPITK